MSDQPLIQITFGLSDPELEERDRLQFSKRVLPNCEIWMTLNVLIAPKLCHLMEG